MHKNTGKKSCLTTAEIATLTVPFSSPDGYSEIQEKLSGQRLP